jgi:hypothetical protein
MNNKQACPVLAIQFNDCASPGPGTLCGKQTDPKRGPALFVAGTTALVCYDRGRQRAPELVHALWEYRQVVLEDNLKEDGLAANGVDEDANLTLAF